MTLPPLDKPIAHNGSPECPVHPETVVCAKYRYGGSYTGRAGNLSFWDRVTTYTIIARAPADRIAELEAEKTRLKNAGHEFADFLENSHTDDNVDRFLNAQICCNGQHCGCQGATVGAYLAYQLRATLKGATDV